MSKPKAIVTRRWPEEVEEKLREYFEILTIRCAYYLLRAILLGFAKNI